MSEGCAPTVTAREKLSIWLAVSVRAAVLSSAQSRKRLVLSGQFTVRFVLKSRTPVFDELFSAASGTQLPTSPLRL